MRNWVLEGSEKQSLLEPAYGLGIFSRAISSSENITTEAYEVDSLIYSYAVRNLPKSVDLKNQDYLKSNWDSKFDAILCNPPYMKFHDYDNAALIPDINRHLGTKLNGFTNIYTLFLLKSIAQLNDGGRLAYIVPSEFLNSDYGVEVKRALVKSGCLKHVIVVDFKETAFDDTLTTACIILCENSKSQNLRFSNLQDINKLDSCLQEFIEYDIQDIDPEKKWKVYFEPNCSKTYRNLVAFSNFAKVSRGIATGGNNYFTFKLSKSYHYDIPRKSLIPCICKCQDVSQTFFDEKAFQELVQNDKTVFLFNGVANEDDQNVKSYIIFGEETGINSRYLTSSRNPWYAIENRQPAPIWVSVFNRNGLRFIRNETNVLNLTTFHCIYPKGEIDTDILFAYLLTDVAKNIFMENSRQYGNGLVKFEPNDLNKGMVVDLRLLTRDECVFIKDICLMIKDPKFEKSGINILNIFFEKKYTSGQVNLSEMRKLCSRAATAGSKRTRSISRNPIAIQLSINNF